MSYTDILLDGQCTSYRTKVDNDLSDSLEDYIASFRKIGKLYTQLRQTKIYEKSIALNSAKGQAGFHQAVTILQVLPVPEEAITPAILKQLIQICFLRQRLLVPTLTPQPPCLINRTSWLWSSEWLWTSYTRNI
jgi:hypothetical protein